MNKQIRITNTGQRDGVISEAIYYVRRPRMLSPWSAGPKQQMLYLPSKTKCGSQ